MEEEIFILRNWHKMNSQELAKPLKVKTRQVTSKKHWMAKTYNNGNMPTEEEVQDMIEKCMERYAEKREKERLIEEQNSFILRNYAEMTNQEMAEELGIAATVVATRRARLINQGLMDKIEQYEKVETRIPIKVPEIQEIPIEVLENQKELKAKIKELDEKLKLGRKYKIKQLNADGTVAIKKKYVGHFEGILVNINKNFYEFKSTSGYRECFLKRDFILGEYAIKEA